MNESVRIILPCYHWLMFLLAQIIISCKFVFTFYESIAADQYSVFFSLFLCVNVRKHLRLWYLLLAQHLDNLNTLSAFFFLFAMGKIIVSSDMSLEMWNTYQTLNSAPHAICPLETKWNKKSVGMKWRAEGDDRCWKRGGESGWKCKCEWTVDSTCTIVNFQTANCVPLLKCKCLSARIYSHRAQQPVKSADQPVCQVFNTARIHEDAIRCMGIRNERLCEQSQMDLQYLFCWIWNVLSHWLKCIDVVLCLWHSKEENNNFVSILILIQAIPLAKHMFIVLPPNVWQLISNAAQAIVWFQII